MTGALDGIRVLDWTWVVAGPYCTRMLADHGAEVIKVQAARMGKRGYVSDASFTTWNRNKLSITLDLVHSEARDLARRLVDLADVVVDNFTPRVMRQWGLDDASLLKQKPDLIVAHLTGMGQDGPYADYVSYGPTAQALSGLTALTSYPQEPPIGIGLAWSDHVAGLTLANAILAALEYRDASGIGQSIDLGQLESTAAFMGTAYLDAAPGTPPAAAGNTGDHPGAGVYCCQGEDRWIAVDGDPAILEILGIPDLAAWATTQDAGTAVELLQAAGIAASIVADARDLIDGDPHLAARGFWPTIDHPTLGPTRADGVPVHLSATPHVPHRASPMLGEQNDRILRDLLGLDTGAFTRLIESGVIR